MRTRSTDEIEGFEFDWLASDADGAVAFFSTAGAGHAPEELLDDTDAYDGAIDSILATPACTDAACSRSDLQNTWARMAERGVFAFDSDPLGGPYKRIASPDQPIRVEQLPAAAAMVAARVHLIHLRFSSLTEISTDQLKRKK